MKKIAYSIFFALFPILALASGSALSFAPPPSDISVVFLGNIFGVVDGVLHGTGSQIMGSMFAVFNSAVLALGGIVIMYTLLVSTVNTAHEGQMLGQKWSSLWVPVRSTFGLALLMPKASGYCLMQIFFMWVVVQGVGAADKVWAAALSYLNRGGVIVQESLNPTESLLGGDGAVPTGAASILSGQVCMLGLQTLLTNTRNQYLKSASPPSETGDCYNATGIMNDFCNTAVPDFIGSVNAVTYQNGTKPLSGTPSYKMPMPNFPSSASPYDMLNGVCGTITWNSLASNMTSINATIPLSPSEQDTVSNSRAIAIQQMYMDLSQVAQTMISFNPAITTQSGTVPVNPASPYALYQYGVPFLTTGNPCTDSNSSCLSWAGVDSTPGNLPALFNGTEFQGAIADYNAIMLPTLNLEKQSKNGKTANQLRAFIDQANASGWILAGSYFFSLANINAASSTTTGSATSNTDQDSGLGTSTSGSDLIGNIATNLTCPPGAGNPTSNTYLCTWFGSKTNADTAQASIIGLLNNGNTKSLPSPSIPSKDTAGNPQNAVPGVLASTAFGFITNSLVIQLPGQPGNTAYQFHFKMIPNFGPPGNLPSIPFSCGSVKIIWPFSFCLVKWIGELLWNAILKYFVEWIFAAIMFAVNKALMLFLKIPLEGMALIFKQGVAFIQQPNVNPIIGLAFMGTTYINFANDLWILLIGVSIVAALVPIVGVVIFALIAMAMPLLAAWMGTMVAIGFLTAYYIPFLPYMIFTFGSIAWLMAVIEAMVAAPIVALGITHPEGEGPFGKAEQAIMILMNVFLRPALMIIGYIAGIILSYVSVWIINAGFSNVATFIMGTGEYSTPGQTSGGYTPFVFKPPQDYIPVVGNNAMTVTPDSMNKNIQTVNGYTGWAGVYGFFFSILIYTMIYITAVQKSFTLIATLPDKVLRWIGGSQEGIGQETLQWNEEAKGKVGEMGKATESAQQQQGKAASGMVDKGIAKLKEPAAAVKGAIS